MKSRYKCDSCSDMNMGKGDSPQLFEAEDLYEFHHRGSWEWYCEGCISEMQASFQPATLQEYMEEKMRDHFTLDNGHIKMLNPKEEQ